MNVPVLDLAAHTETRTGAAPEDRLPERPLR